MNILYCRVKHPRKGAIWLELIFVIAVLAMMIQLWPGLAAAIIRICDVRNWSRATWFVVNLALLALLVTARFSADAIAMWRERSEFRVSQRRAREENRKLQEQRETIQRIIEGRKRRIY